MTNLKNCNGCQLPLPIGCFNKRRSGKPLPRCKACYKAERETKYAQINGARRLHRLVNSVEVREKALAYDARRRETNRARCRAWRRRNPEKQRTACDRWKTLNRDRTRHHNAQRRARHAKALGKFTLEEWQDRCAEYGGRCAYCRRKRKLTRHHVVPLSRGGSNLIANVVPACQSCNSRIGTKIVYPKEGTAT